MEIKYFVYALDTSEGLITAALSCADEQTAKRSYLAAKRKMESEWGESLAFQYGYIGIDSLVAINYTIPPKGGYRNGWYTEKGFDIADFEFAEVQTKKFLSERSVHIARDIEFMRYVISTFEVPSEPVDTPPRRIPPWKQQAVETPSVESELNIADCLCQIQAANGRGVPSIVEAYQASIEEADAPANVIVQNEEPIAVRDAGVAGDMLWALTMSKFPDDRVRRWTLWKHGVGYMEIAKSEHPEWMTTCDEKVARQKYEAEAAKIRMQVKRMEQSVMNGRTIEK